jgi:hypothetical protein
MTEWAGHGCGAIHSTGFCWKGADMKRSSGIPEDSPAPGATTSVHWPRVQEILDGAIAGWKTKNGREPHLQLHGASFGWDTKDKLANTEALDFRLIDPSMVGNGQGAQTNLIVALRDEGGVDDNGQMPARGPFLPADQIDEIVRWIDAGMPD